MKKILLISTLILTACGGGGHKDNNGGNSNMPSPNKPTPGKPISESDASKATYLTHSNSYSFKTKEFKSHSSAENFADKIIINGVTYDLPKTGANFDKIDDFFIKANTMVVNRPDPEMSARYGIINSENAIHSFYNGRKPDSIPTAGVARYGGDAVAVDVTTKANRRFEVGAIVNFKTKDIDVQFEREMKDAPDETFGFKGKLNGHAFNGRGLNGILAGQKAEEMVGTFENEKYVGAFGAEKEIK